jgi:hypothetical protein
VEEPEGAPADGGCTNVPSAEQPAEDRVGRALAQALAAWRTAKDRRAVRRRIHDALLALEDE